MNARVDPAALYAPVAGDNDTALIALCRQTLKALDRDLALDEAYCKLTDRHDGLKPPFPKLPWMYGLAAGVAPVLRAAELREIARGDERSTEFKRKIRVQIAAVTKWERECAALRKALGLAAIDRQYQRAMDESQKLVGLLAETQAQTLIGTSYKATVVARWLTAGYEIQDHGEQLVQSILADVRRLGASAQADLPRRRRTA